MHQFAVEAFLGAIELPLHLGDPRPARSLNRHACLQGETVPDEAL